MAALDRYKCGQIKIFQLKKETVTRNPMSGTAKWNEKVAVDDALENRECRHK